MKLAAEGLKRKFAQSQDGQHRREHPSGSPRMQREERGTVSHIVCSAMSESDSSAAAHVRARRRYDPLHMRMLALVAVVASASQAAFAFSQPAQFTAASVLRPGPARDARRVDSEDAVRGMLWPRRRTAREDQARRGLSGAMVKVNKVGLSQQALFEAVGLAGASRISISTPSPSISRCLERVVSVQLVQRVSPHSANTSTSTRTSIAAPVLHGATRAGLSPNNTAPSLPGRPPTLVGGRIAHPGQD
ncbi:hypothetical protein PSPO01_02748 [Paraphaeosphaeria sporulosa]